MKATNPRSQKPTRDPWVKVPVELIDGAELSNRAFRFYAKLRQYAWESNGSKCSLTQARLTAELRWSPETITKAGRELVDAGLVKITRTGGANLYQLLDREIAASVESEIPLNSGIGTRETAASDTAEQRYLPVEVDALEVPLTEQLETAAAHESTENVNDGIDRAVELAAFVKAETGIEPKVGPGDAAALDALFSEYGEDTYWQAAAFAANHTKTWGERITDKLARYTGGFEYVLKDMAKESASSNATVPERGPFVERIMPGCELEALAA